MIQEIGRPVPPGDEDGRTLAARDAQAPLRDRLRSILEVVPGERWLQPELGCRLHTIPLDDDGYARPIVAALVAEALTRWAPDLEADRVEVTELRGGRVRLCVRTRGSWVDLWVRHRSPASSGEES